MNQKRAAETQQHGKPFLAKGVFLCAEKNRFAGHFFGHVRLIGLILIQLPMLIKKSNQSQAQNHPTKVAPKGAKRAFLNLRPFFGTELAASVAVPLVPTNFSTPVRREQKEMDLMEPDHQHCISVQIEEDRASYPYQLNIFLCILSLKTAKISAAKASSIDEVIPFGIPSPEVYWKGDCWSVSQFNSRTGEVFCEKVLDQGASTKKNAHERLITRIMQHESW